MCSFETTYCTGKPILLISVRFRFKIPVERLTSRLRNRERVRERKREDMGNWIEIHKTAGVTGNKIN